MFLSRVGPIRRGTDGRCRAGRRPPRPSGKGDRLHAGCEEEQRPAEAAMPQIFHRSFNVISRVSIFGAIFFLAALGWVGANTVRSPYYTNAFVAVEQPVPFSHRHHVGGLKIDCRYCHTSVEDTGFAGMPTTKTC